MPSAPAPQENRYTPLRFVLAFGVVSMLADFVYEGGRSIVGPYLATLGASATGVGAVTGLGEAVASVLRLASGPVADRTRRYWPISIAGYAITAVSVPVLAAAGSLWQASLAVVGERFGKAVRTPARDTMLSHASAELGRGRAFAYHEALDQSGALLGPLLVAGTASSRPPTASPGSGARRPSAPSTRSRRRPSSSSSVRFRLWQSSS